MTVPVSEMKFAISYNRLCIILNMFGVMHPLPTRVSHDTCIIIIIIILLFYNASVYIMDDPGYHYYTCASHPRHNASGR